MISKHDERGEYYFKHKYLWKQLITASICNLNKNNMNSKGNVYTRYGRAI